MSNQCGRFVEERIRENAVKPVEGAPAGDNSEARLRAEACLAAAKYEGIAREDSRRDRRSAAWPMIANLDHPEKRGRRLRMTTREEFIRTKALQCRSLARRLAGELFPRRRLA